MPEPDAYLGQYLRARRALVLPEDVGLAREPGRRVSGLRRDEVARLAGISADYYHRLEQGRDRHPSEEVLFALARALQLDEFALDYARRLAEAGPPAGQRLPPTRATEDRQDVAEADQDLVVLVENWARNPSFVVDGNQDVVASNKLARLISHGALSVGQNLVLNFFSEPARSTAPDWEESAAAALAALRYYSDPSSPRLQQLVTELGERSENFAEVWARHDARPLRGGRMRYELQNFGAIDFAYQSLIIPGRRGYVLTTLYAEQDGPGSAALAYLGAL
jgi:transcriptional regulator with XRE-family HTH domain